jgi:cytochrome c
MPARILPASLAFGLALSILSGSADADSSVAAGQRLVVDKCAPCHAVGRSDLSPKPGAPPFRSLHLKYPVAHLAEALAEGITTGHSDMPEFVFSPDEIAAILAYIEDLSAPPAAK